MSQHVHLPGFLGTLAPLPDHWEYFAVGFLLLVEDFGVPAPGETVLIAASLYAGAGRLNIVAVGAIASAAAILGDNIGYAIGRFAGRTLVLRYGRYILLNEKRLAKAEAFFTRHGGKIVTKARFIEGLRQANGIIAGITGMPWLRFLAFNTLGAALWVGTWTSLGYLAGPHHHHLQRRQLLRPLRPGGSRPADRGADRAPPPHAPRTRRPRGPKPERGGHTANSAAFHPDHRPQPA